MKVIPIKRYYDTYENLYCIYEYDPRVLGNRYTIIGQAYDTSDIRAKLLVESDFARYDDNSIAKKSRKSKKAD